MNETALPNTHTDSARDPVAARLMQAAQYVLVVVFGLLPIFFVPVQAAPFSYSKVLFVIIGLAVSLILYSFAVLRVGEIRVRMPLPIMFFWGVALVAVVSAVLSGDLKDALLGNAFEVQSALFIVLLALTATMWTCFASNRVAVMRMFLLLALSTLVLGLFHISRVVFGSDVILPGLFGGDVTNSVFGGWNDLGIFFGLIVIIALIALEQLSLNRLLKGVFIVSVLLSLGMLAAVNFTAIWVILGFISLISVIYSLRQGRGTHETLPGILASPRQGYTSLFMSIIVFLISVLFVIAGSFFGDMISRSSNISYVEVRPSFSATTEITRQVYSENALLGVGANRFSDAYRQYKDPTINNTAFWSVDFETGVGYIPTAFVTLGALGGLLWLAFFLVFVVRGIRAQVQSDKNSRIWYFIGTASFVGALYIWSVMFFYAPGPVLLLLGATFTGLAIASHDSLRKHSTHIFTLGSASNARMNVALIVVSTVLIIGSISALYFVGKHYASVYTFNVSTVEANTGADIDTVERTAVRAFNLFGDDRYARRIAEFQLARIASLLQVQEPTDEQRTQFSNAIANGQEAGRRATTLDESDPNNWMVLGNVYYALVSGGVEGAYERALEAFQRARELDPRNPARVLALAQLELARGNNEEARDLARTAVDMKPNYREAVYFLSQVQILLGNLEEARQNAQNMIVLEPNNPVHYFQIGLIDMTFENLSSATQAFERAIELESDYANARYYLALAYDAQGRSDEALEHLQHVLNLNPDNGHVYDLIERLNNGESLEGAVQNASLNEGEANAEPPVEESENVTETEEGTAVTNEDPDSPLLSPVNPSGGDQAETESETENATNTESTQE